MKHTMKLAALSAMIVAFAGAAAYADDSQLQNRLAVQRAQDTKTGTGLTIALFGNHKGIGEAKNDVRPKLRFETRYNSEGEAFGVYTTAE